MKLFDSHAHVNDGRFDNDRTDMLQACFDAGVEYILIPGVDRDTVESGIALAEQYEQLYAAVGTHPHESKDFTDEDYEFYKEQALHNDKVRAIGEIGLDYYYDFSDRDTQKRVFIRHLELARDVDLPIIIHDRDAHGDIMDILRNEGKDNWGYISLLFGQLGNGEGSIKMGFYISFAGPVVFPKSTNLKEVARQVPLDRILIETDSPYLTPPPFRGRRNDPSKTQFVAEEIANLKGMDVDEFCDITFNNAKRVFGIE
nr:TatD family hydrolase [Veillonella denticariosi]